MIVSFSLLFHFRNKTIFSDENIKNDFEKNEIPGYDFFTLDEWLEWCAGLDDHFVTKETLMEIVNELDESFD